MKSIGNRREYNKNEMRNYGPAEVGKCMRVSFKDKKSIISISDIIENGNF